MQYEYLKDQDCEFFTFDSMGEMADEVLRLSKGNDRIHRWCEGGSWTGRRFGNAEGVVKAVDSVWPEGMAVYDKMMDQLRDESLPQPKSLRRRGVWSEEGGDELSIDRLRAGQEPWRATKRDHRPGPMTVTIITDVTSTAMTNHKDILWRGAAAVCLTEILERAGYRVELWAAQYCRHAFTTTDRGMASAVNLKKTSDPLDASTLINCVSGWSYRTMFFASYYLSKYTPNSGLGLVTPIDTILPAFNTDEQAFVSKNIDSLYAAIQWVKSKLEEVIAR